MSQQLRALGRGPALAPQDGARVASLVPARRSSCPCASCRDIAASQFTAWLAERAAVGGRGARGQVRPARVAPRHARCTTAA